VIIADTFSWLSWVISQITPKKLCTTATFKTPAKATETQTQISSVMLIHKQVQCSAKTTDKQTQISTAPVSIELIKDDNKKMRDYTGLNDYKLFCIIHTISKCDDKQCEAIFISVILLGSSKCSLLRISCYWCLANLYLITQTRK